MLTGQSTRDNSYLEHVDIYCADRDHETNQSISYGGLAAEDVTSSIGSCFLTKIRFIDLSYLPRRRQYHLL